MFFHGISIAIVHNFIFYFKIKTNHFLLIKLYCCVVYSDVKIILGLYSFLIYNIISVPPGRMVRFEAKVHETNGVAGVNTRSNLELVLRILMGVME